MIINNDICYAGQPNEWVKVISVTPLENRKLLVLFNSGEKKIFDTRILKGEAFDELENNDVFSKPSVFHGAITWKNGEIDVAPEMIYEYGLNAEDVIEASCIAEDTDLKYK